MNFPQKLFFANNLITIDWRVVYYVYLSLAQLSWSKKGAKCICTIDNIWNKAKKIFANWGLSSISMDFVYWATCTFTESYEWRTNLSIFTLPFLQNFNLEAPPDSATWITATEKLSLDMEIKKKGQFSKYFKFFTFSVHS